MTSYDVPFSAYFNDQNEKSWYVAFLEAFEAGYVLWDKDHA